LIEILGEGDREIRHMAIWALGEIGGADARRALQELAALTPEEDGDEHEAIEDALGTLALSDDDLDWMLFSDLDEDD
jgi:hypothetical protein